MIAVEGADGTGKTTLVQSLVKDLGLTIAKRGTSNRDELYKVTREDTARALSNMASCNKPAEVWDRLGPFSDPIYCLAQRRDPAFNLASLTFAKALIRAAKSPVIICDVPLFVATENMEREHQMDGVEAEFPFIHGRYKNLIESLTGHCLTYDYRVEGAYQDILERCKHYLVERKDREWS